MQLLCNTAATNCSIDVSGTKFSGNSSDSGGALALFGATAVSIRDGRFDGNSATGEGGAVFFDPKSAHNTKFELRFSVFKNNQARQGGAVRILASSLIAQTVTFSKIPRPASAAQSPGPIQPPRSPAACSWTMSPTVAARSTW